METQINITAYSDALVILGTAGIIVPLVVRFGINPVLAYLGAGALLGPAGLGSLLHKVPVLYWFTVVDARNVEGIAELGIVFLLFLIGLELSFQRLKAMRRLVFGLGLLQVLITTAILTGAGVIAGLATSVAAVLGATLSLSSTAIVLELLSREGRMGSHTGRASFSVLLAQDLAVIPILMFISLVGAESNGSVLESLVRALVQGAIALASITALARLLLRPVFRQVAATRSSELFIAAVLFVILGASVVAHQSGLSMALGAFVAGLLLAETEYGKKVEVTIEPFKGLLLGIFFFTVGMNIDIREIVRQPLILGAAIIGVLMLKAGVLFILGRVFGLSRGIAAETALLLAPGSEFAFVGVGLAAASQLLPAKSASLALAAVSISMALTPLLAFVGRHTALRLTATAAPDPELVARPESERPQVIVVGYGRVGRIVCSLFAEHEIPYIAIDHSATTVSAERHQGRRALFYGDAADEAFLKACGLDTARGLIITIDAHATIDDIVRTARGTRPDLLIVARARDAVHAQHLYGVGATMAVPETVEASFQLSEAALVGVGVAPGLAIASIHERRERLRNDLRSAAERSGGNANLALHRGRKDSRAEKV